MDEQPGTDERSWDGVLDAGRVLFGARAETVLGGRGWRRELKRAYRRRALETHPDRARSLGRAESELAREFRAVVAAYQLLMAAPERLPARSRGRPPAPRSTPRREPPAGRARPARDEAPATPDRRRSRKAAGSRGTGIGLPQRRLRLAEFLFYSGRIPFEALVEGLAWQRRQRPPVGRIAVESGYLTQAQVLEVMERRLRSGDVFVPFAEYATRIGLLTPFARLAVLGRQRKRQRRIGRFFAERGWVTEEELDAARGEMLMHNLRHGGSLP